MKKLILIKYGELTTKKDNRKMFIRLLENNIKNLLKDINFSLHCDRVRMYIEVDEIDLDNTVSRLKNVFGIHSIVVCHQVNTNNDDIKNKVLELVKCYPQAKTFKIETKRAWKEFPIHSMEFNCLIAGFVLKNSSLKVDVHMPDLLIKIEIRNNGTYIYTNEIEGAGGYPVGVQGKGLLMLSGGIDSPVAGYLALKRGVD